MTNWFEDLTKTLADEKLSRRQAILRAAGIVAGAAFASLTSENGMASSLAILGPAPTKKCGFGACYKGGTCTNLQFNNCPKNSNTNCYCWQDISGLPGVCGCNTYCSSAQPCSSDAGCSKNYACITNTGCGCNTGVCVALCKGKNKNCVLSNDGAGRTAAPRSTGLQQHASSFKNQESKHNVEAPYDVANPIDAMSQLKEQIPGVFTIVISPPSGDDDSPVVVGGTGLGPAGACDEMWISFTDATGKVYWVFSFDLTPGQTKFNRVFPIDDYPFYDSLSDAPAGAYTVQAVRYSGGVLAESSATTTFTLGGTV